MIKNQFSSDKSEDVLEISYFKKSHKSNLYIKTFDDVSAHIELLGEVLTFLKNNGIQWVCVSIPGKPEIPENAVFFEHEKTGKICCHVEGFEDFYLKNLNKMLSIQQVHLDPGASKTKDGWTMVVNKKTLKTRKYEEIKKEVSGLVADWNKL